MSDSTGSTDSQTLPVPDPSINPETLPFWTATTQGTLQVRRCADCEELVWYPRSICPSCGSFNTEWLAVSGRGHIYTFAINRRGVRWYDDERYLPYVLAYVELEEGPRLLTNIIGCEPSDLEIGQAVELEFQPCDSGAAALFRFRPTRSL
jgi:uncharacterized OB-fold protein